jgi:hypothetical protein
MKASILAILAIVITAKEEQIQSETKLTFQVNELTD